MRSHQGRWEREKSGDSFSGALFGNFYCEVYFLYVFTSKGGKNEKNFKNYLDKLFGIFKFFYRCQYFVF